MKFMIKKTRFIALLLGLVLIMASLAGCSKEPKSDLEKVILTIDDKEYTLQDIMYILYSVENEASTQAYYSQMYGGDAADFWNQKDEETGKTVREQVKESVLDTATMIFLMEEKAKEAGYKLTDEELLDVEDEVDSVLSNMKDKEEYLKRTGFTEENLKDMVTQYNLAYKYYMDQISSVKVDESSIKETIDPEEYAQVEVEYISFSTGELDNSGNYSLYEPEKISEILKKAQAAYDEVKAGADMQKTGEKYFSEEYTVDTGTMSLYKSPEENDENLYNAFKDLKEGELCSGVIEASDGYYIIRLINENSTEAYDEAVKEKLTELQMDAYQDEYDAMLKDYKIKINEDNWAAIEVGNYAFPPMEDGADADFDYDEDNTDSLENTEDTDNTDMDEDLDGGTESTDEPVIDDDGAVG